MDFTKDERDQILRAMGSVTTTFAIFSEPDESEDGTTQMIRKKLREYADRLFDLKDEVNEFMNNFKDELE